MILDGTKEPVPNGGALANELLGIKNISNIVIGIVACVTAIINFAICYFDVTFPNCIIPFRSCFRE